jgi:hypothetical protein
MTVVYALQNCVAKPIHSFIKIFKSALAFILLFDFIIEEISKDCKVPCCH